MRTYEGTTSLALLQSAGTRFRRAAWINSGLLSLALLLISPQVSWGQYMGAFGIPWNNPVSASLSMSMWSNWVVYQTQMKQAHGGAVTSAGKASTPSGAAASVKVDDAAFRFHSTGTHLLTKKLSEQMGKTPAEKQQVATLLDAIFQEFDKQSVKLGKPNDLGLALSFFLAQNATIYRGAPDPADAQFLELRDTIVYAADRSGGLKQMSDMQKQELYELLVAYTGLCSAGYVDSKNRGNQAQTQEFRRLAGLNLKAITHIEPERIDFTPAQVLSIRPAK